jgi:anti-sigma factor RsiW
MKTMKDDCRGIDSELAEMLLDPNAASARVREHVAHCERCSAELAAMQATMGLLDEWQVAEPNPYFLTRMGARLAEERRSGSASVLGRWMARLKAGFVYGPQTHVRPLAAMALTALLLVGGGAYLGVTNWDQTQTTSPNAAAVHDLQTMDKNAQLLDQLEALSTAPDNNGD